MYIGLGGKTNVVNSSETKISRAYNTGRSDRALNGSSISEIFCPGGCCNPKRVSHKNSNFVEGNGPGSQDYSIPISRQ